MLRNKLLCLEYPNPDAVNVSEDKQFRNLVLWLEDQKIRNYKIEDRAELRQINSTEWPKVFEKYKNDLSCPSELTSKLDQLKWIIAYAIKLEYLDNGNVINLAINLRVLIKLLASIVDEYRAVTSKKVSEAEKNKSSAPSVKSVNPFDNLDCKFPNILYMSYF